MKIGRTLPPAAVPIPWQNIYKAAWHCLSDSAEPVTKFEDELKSHFGVKYCFLLNSGKAALTTILQVLHHFSPEKDEVLIPAFTCYSVPAAIKNAGLKIRLCDLNIDSFDFERKKLKDIADIDKQRHKLLCAIPTHLFGIPADIPTCRDILGPDITIIEDAAQAMGTEWQGIKLGTQRDISFFSLGRGKALSTVEGGIILTNNEKYGDLLAQKVSELKEYRKVEKFKLIIKASLTNILLKPFWFWLPKSLPFLRLGETIYQPNFKVCKLSNSHCCLAENWLEILEILKSVRKKNIQGYITKNLMVLEMCPFPWHEKIQPLIRLPIVSVSKEKRDKIVHTASQKGLGLMPSYPAPINEISELKNEFENDHFVTAKKICDLIITLPVHDYVSSCDQQNIIDILSKHQSS